MIFDMGSMFGYYTYEVECKSFFKLSNIKHIISAGILFNTWIIFRNIENLTIDIIMYLSFAIKEIANTKNANKKTIHFDKNEFFLSYKS